MKGIIKSIVVVLIFALLGGCASSGPYKERIMRVSDMHRNDVGLVYGQIVMPSDMWYMRHVEILQVKKVYVFMGRPGEKISVSPDGKFAAANLKPGKYMLSGFTIGSEHDILGRNALKYTIEVKPGRINYFGALNYIEGKAAGMFSNGTFGLEYDMSRKRHAEILNWLSKSTANTRWQPMVDKELKAYKSYLPKAEKTDVKIQKKL